MSESVNPWPSRVAAIVVSAGCISLIGWCLANELPSLAFLVTVWWPLLTFGAMNLFDERR